MDEERVAFNVTMLASLLGRRLIGNRERLRQALEQTGLHGREDDLAGFLSGGEKKRLALARAFTRTLRSCSSMSPPPPSMQTTGERSSNCWRTSPRAATPSLWQRTTPR